MIKRCYDRKARDLPKLSIGQSIYFEHKEGENWIKGTVLKRQCDRSYIVKSEDGAEYWRNRVRIRPAKVQVRIRDRSPQSDIREPFQTCRGPVSTETTTWRSQVKMLEVKILQKKIKKKKKKKKKKIKTLVNLFLNTFFFFLKYFTIIVGAISKTTSVLKLSQDPSAKNIKCHIKIKIKIFSI